MGSSPKKAARRKGAMPPKPAEDKRSAARADAARKGAPAKPAVADGAALDGVSNVAWICLNLLLILVPIAMSNFTWTGISQLPFTYDQFDIVKVVVMRGLTLVAYAALGWRLLVAGGKWRKTPMDWAVLVFLVWVVITTIVSIHWPTAVFGKYRRFEGLISFVNYAAVFFLAVQFVDRPSRIRDLARSVFAGAVVVAGYGAMQVIGIDPINWGNNLPFEAQRAFSTFGNPDLLGGYLVLVLPLGLALAFEQRETWRRALYWAGFLLITYTWITAFVRGAWIGGVVALGVMVFVIVRRREKLESVDWAFLAAIGLMAAVVVVKSLSAQSEVMNVIARLKDIVNFKSGSGLTRTQIWQAAIAAIKDRPIFGFGADTFRLIFPKYKPVEYVQAAGYLSVADNAHSYPLQVMTAFGIPGFLLLYGLFAFGLFRSAAGAFSRDEGGERLILAALWAGAAGYIVHLLAGLSVTGSTVILWAFLGILLAPLASSREIRPPSWGVFAALGGLVLAAVLFVGNITYVIADNRYLDARIASTPQEYIASAKAAIALNPYNDMYRIELGRAYQAEFIDALNSLSTARSSGQEGRPEAERAIAALNNAEQVMKATIAYVPWEYDNYVFLANLDNIAADYGVGDEWRVKAEEVAKEGVKVERFGPAIRLQLAVAYKGQGKTDLALKELQTAVSMDPRYVDGNLELGNIYRDKGDWARAAEAYQRVLAVDAANTEAKSSLAAVEASRTIK